MAKKAPIAVPWTQDAIDLDLPQALDELRQLLHENSEIRQFLNETYPGSRETKFFNICAKRFWQDASSQVKEDSCITAAPRDDTNTPR